MKKLLLIITVMLSLSLIAGAWIFIIQGDLEMVVNSLRGTESVIINFPSIEMNTTNATDVGYSYFDFIYNKEGTFYVSIIETFIDNSEGECLDGEDDCEVNYYLNKGEGYVTELINNRTVNVSYNTNVKRIEANMTCIAYSCPQTRNIRISLEEI